MWRDVWDARTHLQLTNWDTQIGLVEAVRNVPAKRTELDSLLNESVKEAETKQELFKFLQNVQNTAW